MPTRCSYRPNRSLKRTFRPKDAGRVVCATIENGFSPDDVRAAIEKCLPEREAECDCEAIGQRLRRIEQLLIAISLIATLLVPWRRLAGLLVPATRNQLPKATRDSIASIEAGARQMEKVKPVVEIELEAVRKLLADIQRRAAEELARGARIIIRAPN